MRVSVTTRVTRRGDLGAHLARVEAALRGNGPMAVKAGLPAGKAPADLIRIGGWQHFGTAGGASGGGWGGPIPPRPFITVAFFKGRGPLRAALRRAARAAFRGAPLSAELPGIGEAAASLIRAQVQAGMAPANAPTTVRLKGFDKPLTHTGALAAGITWKLDG